MRNIVLWCYGPMDVTYFLWYPTLFPYLPALLIGRLFQQTKLKNHYSSKVKKYFFFTMAMAAYFTKNLYTSRNKKIKFKLAVIR